MKKLWRILLWGFFFCGGVAAELPCKVDILFVGAHPDDDSVATATLARLVDEGKRVGVVCATRGEMGGNAIGRESGPALGIVRETEQRAVLRKLGITQVYYLDRLDSGFTTSIQVSEKNWGHQSTLERLVHYVRVLQPQVLVTMNPAPRGHGDHQLAARLTSEAFFLSGRAEAFPRHLSEESLRPWSPSRLYYSLEYGAEGLQPSLEVACGAYAPREAEALKLYRSQGWDREAPPQRDRESFILGADRLPGQALLGGLDGPVVRINRAAQRIEIEPIPAVANFRVWAKRWKLEHLVTLTPAEVVLGQGQTGQLRGRVVGPDASVSFQGRDFGLGGGRNFQLPVKAPNIVGTYPLQIQSTLATDSILLKVVPWMKTGWQGISAVWEGHNDGPSDCGARFQMKVGRESLHFEVEVQDDQVLDNLAADDNCAHWRTDSVEICIDPSGVSQNTLSTFKLGIVPFNRQGRCMAARDADARPGPVPAMRVSSRRVAGGYAISADIPRADLPGPLGDVFGLNVLVYDLDKDGSSSRLAWSSWETVQGEPRLWGKVKR